MWKIEILATSFIYLFQVLELVRIVLEHIFGAFSGNKLNILANDTRIYSNSMLLKLFYFILKLCTNEAYVSLVSCLPFLSLILTIAFLWKRLIKSIEIFILLIIF